MLARGRLGFWQRSEGQALEAAEESGEKLSSSERNKGGHRLPWSPMDGPVVAETPEGNRASPVVLAEERRSAPSAPPTTGGDRTCPACRHERPVGTTCLDCERCLGDELTDAEEEKYEDLLADGPVFGGFEAYPGLLMHNRNLRLHASCDGTCGMTGCRRPYFDRAGLTRYRDDEPPPPGQEGGTA